MNAKLKLLERTAGITPSAGHSSSQGMQRLERQQQRREQMAPAPVQGQGMGLGACLEDLIEQMVEQRVAEALEQHKRQQELLKPPMPTDYRQLPPVPQTQPLKATEITMQRDELGRVCVVNAGRTQWRVERGALGQVVRMVPADEVAIPAPSAVPYRESVHYEGHLIPRRLYGNEPEL